MLWKEQPNTPTPGLLESLWDGNQFIIRDKTTGFVVLRINADDNTVAANLPDSSVTPSKLKGLGASASYAKTADGAYTHIAASAAERRVIVTLEVTEVFADNAGTQTTFTIGDTTTADGILAVTELADAALGVRITVGGTITADEPLVVTAEKATVDGMGAVKITAIAVQ